MEAHKLFLETGDSDTLCDNCGEKINFEKIGENAERSSCKCGKYNSTLRG